MADRVFGSVFQPSQTPFTQQHYTFSLPWRFLFTVFLSALVLESILFYRISFTFTFDSASLAASSSLQFIFCFDSIWVDLLLTSTHSTSHFFNIWFHSFLEMTKWVINFERTVLLSIKAPSRQGFSLDVVGGGGSRWSNGKFLYDVINYFYILSIILENFSKFVKFLDNFLERVINTDVQCIEKNSKIL